MPSQDNPNEVLTKEAAIAQVSAILNEVYIMGANDYEIPELHRILKDIQIDKITPEEGLKQAHKIKASKCDYH